MIYLVIFTQIFLIVLCVISDIKFKNNNISEINIIKNKKIVSVGFLFYFIIYLWLFLISGLRDVGIDQDSMGYLNYYESIDIEKFAEPSFVWISSAVKLLFNDFQWVLIIYSFLGISLKFYAIYNYSEKIYLSVLIYFSNYYLLHDFTQIRVAVASGLFLLSIKYIFNRNILKFTSCICIATLFHYSAAIIFPIYIIGSRKFIKKYAKLICYLLLPFAFTLYYINLDIYDFIPQQYLSRKIIDYKNMLEYSGNKLNIFNLLYMCKYVIYLIILLNYEKIYEKIKYFPILLIIYGISLFIYIGFSLNYAVSQRLSELLGIVEIFLIVSIYYIFKNNLGKFIIISISLFYFLINIFHENLITNLM